MASLMPDDPRYYEEDGEDFFADVINESGLETQPQEVVHTAEEPLFFDRLTQQAVAQKRWQSVSTAAYS